MKVYLSGPMSGFPESNFPAFHATAAALRAKGFDVVNPAEINDDQGPDVSDTEAWTAFYNQCLRADLREMMDCDAIALMDGWQRSAGANLELHVAHRVGMDVFFVDELLSVEAVSEPTKGDMSDRPVYVYEDDLPESMTDDEYDVWFKLSKIVDGVRVGPSLSEVRSLIRLRDAFLKEDE